MKNKRLVIGLALCLILLISLASVYHFNFRLNKNPVDVVKAPPELTLPEIVDPTETVSETPDDIDQDYLHEIVELEKVPIYEQVEIDSVFINILLVGTDLRPDEQGYGRSDSMLVASYNSENNNITLVSLMRDTWVSIPGHGSNRINAAYAFGGIGLAINTVNLNFDLDIQKYAIVDFESLPKIIDKLGGVSVDLTMHEIEIINQANPADVLPSAEGVHHLNGAQVLTHTRNRSTGDGDFSRTRRQRDVMSAALQQLRQNKNPAKMASVLAVILPLLDTNMTYNELYHLGIGFLGSESFSLSHERIPQDETWQYATITGRSVIKIDLPANQEYLHKILYR